MKNIWSLHIILFLFLVVSCNNDDDATPKTPSAAALIFPLENSECTEGVISPSNNNQSTITFEWNVAEHADSYQLLVKNLNTNNTQTFASNTNTLEVTLSRGTPYAWYVISLNNNSQETAESEEWKFYNAGQGVETYPPFPADLLEPSSGSTVYASNSSVSFTWSGSDIEGDIANYEIFIGNNNPPSTSVQSNITEEEFTHTAFEIGIYYWQIKTIDDNGNSSLSEVSQFKVE
ncbi:hypothetical protein HX109_07980 [Galbibacter sp. BG1]|uniref:hypothetical protein n=1 Tax=Galbibacter sp. BG1 TaxID=1170699 RepID=UPI0015BC1766|nr:hypothetical protein [Galbibacter sp. BG1]QLE01505.1 hypothetical protein HX109_07980 [Galbibacter sp. BG1]